MAILDRKGVVVDSQVTISAGSVITMYTNSDGRGDQEMGLEVSPDNGSTWQLVGSRIGSRPLTVVCAATMAQARVLAPDGTGAKGSVTIIVR